MERDDGLPSFRENRETVDNRNYSIDIIVGADGDINITAGFTESFRTGYPPLEEFEPYIPSADELAEMESDDREFYESYDYEQYADVYLKKIGALSEKYDDYKEQCDILADALEITDISQSMSEQAQQAFMKLSNFLHQVQDSGTRDMYSRVAPRMKRLIEYADRLVQLYHLSRGSTYTTPMDKLYSLEEDAACADDFFHGVEAGLAKALSDAMERDYVVSLESPDHARFINQTSNLTDAIVRKAGATDFSRVWEETFSGAFHAMIDDYRAA